MRHPRLRVTRLLLVVAFTAVLSACRGCAGKDELAFCEAVERKDAAAAQALLDSGRLNILARNATGTCQPIMLLFHAATPQSPAFTTMAVAVAKRDGMANTCWSTPGSGGRSAGRSSGGSSECPIQVVAGSGNLVLMRALVDAGVNVKNQVARGSMASAVGQGSLEMVRLLVEAGVDPSAGLGSAISYRRPAIVSYLESKGARESGVDDLLIAARQGDLAAINAAIGRGANLEVQDGNGLTPLMRAAYFGHADAVTRLAKAGAKVDQTAEGKTALHLAANENDVPVIKALAAAGANLNARSDSNSPTPLYVAVENGASAAVGALVTAGADANAALDSDTTLIVRSVELGNLSMARDLLRGGARVNDKRGARWKPPIHASLGICGYAPEGAGDNDYYRVTLLQALVAAGADTKAKNAEGLTPIEVVTKALGTADRPFYVACYQAKLDYLRTLR